MFNVVQELRGQRFEPLENGGLIQQPERYSLMRPSPSLSQVHLHEPLLAALVDNALDGIITIDEDWNDPVI